MDVIPPGGMKEEEQSVGDSPPPEAGSSQSPRRKYRRIDDAQKSSSPKGWTNPPTFDDMVLSQPSTSTIGYGQGDTQAEESRSSSGSEAVRASEEVEVVNRRRVHPDKAPATRKTKRARRWVNHRTLHRMDAETAVGWWSLPSDCFECITKRCDTRSLRNTYTALTLQVLGWEADPKRLGDAEYECMKRITHAKRSIIAAIIAERTATFLAIALEKEFDPRSEESKQLKDPQIWLNFMWSPGDVFLRHWESILGREMGVVTRHDNLMRYILNHEDTKHEGTCPSSSRGKCDCPVPLSKVGDAAASGEKMLHSQHTSHPPRESNGERCRSESTGSDRAMACLQGCAEHPHEVLKLLWSQRYPDDRQFRPWQFARQQSGNRPNSPVSFQSFLPLEVSEFVTLCKAGEVDMVKYALVHDSALDPTRLRNAAFRGACRQGQTQVVKLLLSLEGERKVDVTSSGNYALRFACRNGHTLVVKELLSLPPSMGIDPRANYNDALILASAHGHLAIVRMLLAWNGGEAGVLDITGGESFAFRIACSRGYLQVARELMAVSDRPPIDPTAVCNYAFRTAASAGNLTLIRALLRLESEAPIHVQMQDHGGCGRFSHRETGSRQFVVRRGRGVIARGIGLLHLFSTALARMKEYIGVGSSNYLVDPTDMNDSALRGACENGHLQVFKLLMSLRKTRRARVPDPSHNNSLALASRGGHLAIVRSLCTFSEIPLVDGYFFSSEALQQAAAQGHVSVVKELLGRCLTQGNFDIKAPFVSACTSGHVDVVKLFLATNLGRNSASCYNNLPLRRACRYGHRQIVRELLAVSGPGWVDPTCECSSPFSTACEYGHLGIVRDLLALKGEREVDPAAENNYALRRACSNGHLEIITDLLHFRCKGVDPTVALESGSVLSDPQTLQRLNQQLKCSDYQTRVEQTRHLE